MANKTFGSFLTQLRTSRNINRNHLATVLHYSHSYIGDVENGYRKPINRLDKLNKIVSFLKLNEEETQTLFNLVGKQRHEAPPDIVEYIIDNDYVSRIIRLARDLDASEKDWKRFERSLKRHYKGGGVDDE